MTRVVPFPEAVRVWLRVGLQSFGGPAGQIAVMHRIVVEEKGWLDERRFGFALSYCMMLPGPEAQQLATYCGWLLHGWRGGVVAGTLFVLPGALVMLGLSALYALGKDLDLVAALFFGLKAAVLAVVVDALLRIGRRVLRHRALWTLAGAAFLGIFFLGVPFPLVVLGAGIVGGLGCRWRPEWFDTGGGGDGARAHVRPPFSRSLGVLAIWGGLWLGPVAVLGALLGTDHVLFEEAIFFSKAAMVTFGGAYAVLPYVAQAAVETHGWLGPGEMLDGLGLSETTPGPLILVLQFVGFLGAWRMPGTWEPLLSGVAGAAVTTWCTFTPCFLWIFLGAPYVEALRGRRALAAALAAITAAVVGVILNLAVWFAVHTLFASVTDARIGPLRVLVPDWGTVDLWAAALTVGSMVAMFRFEVGMMPVLAGAAAAGVAIRVLT